MLEIKTLHVEREGKEIIKGVSLTCLPHQVHALMGPNGSGKSTLTYALMGHPKYTITQGKVLLEGKDITQASPDERARAGLFLSFQYPQEISGVTIGKFLRTVVNAHRTTQGLQLYSVVEFHQILKQKMAELQLDPTFSRRYLHVGFSGGEKKKIEILQLLLIQPKYAMLDETDSGLDVDAIKVVAQHLNNHKSTMGILVITHYQRFLEYLHPDTISVLLEGKIVQHGGAELATAIEEKGFTGVFPSAP